MNSLIIPVYKNEENIPTLIEALIALNNNIDQLEIIFVIDGSPDNSATLLKTLIPKSGLKAQIILLSRNFGSFAAIRTGLEIAQGEYFAVMAADLQEPPELIIKFFKTLAMNETDIVIGIRQSRLDSWHSSLLAKTFWSVYKKLIMPEMPHGGVDVFGCNRLFRENIIKLDESHSSLVALIFWMGFRRKAISYSRQKRLHGKSAWSFRKKYSYLKDSVFSFTDLPIKLLSWIGSFGIILSFVLMIIVLICKMNNWISIPGYSATILVISFFGALNVFGLGIIGTYAWRTYENTKQRPMALIMEKTSYPSSAQNPQEKS